MKIVYILLFLQKVLCECSYYKNGITHYCDECCYWYDGDWYCESYGFCYTSVAIALLAWTFICLGYVTLYYNSKKKTLQRIAQIHDLAVKAQREMIKEKKVIDTDTPTEQIEIINNITQNLQISNDQL